MTCDPLFQPTCRAQGEVFAALLSSVALRYDIGSFGKESLGYVLVSLLFVPLALVLYFEFGGNISCGRLFKRPLRRLEIYSERLRTWLGTAKRKDASWAAAKFKARGVSKESKDSRGTRQSSAPFMSSFSFGKEAAARGWKKADVPSLALWGRKGASGASPLKSLGPFEMATLSPRDIGFVKHPNTQKFTVSLTGELATLAEDEWAFIGNAGWCTQWSAITLARAARADAGIPEHAAFFAWAFPLLGMTANASQQLLAGRLTHAMYFAVNGGFVYADERLQPVQCNAVKGQGDHLHFDGPHRLDETKREELTHSHELRAPTIKFLLDKQIMGFTWVEPGTTGMVTAAGKECSNGAFVYVYGEGDKQYDCFFRVSDVVRYDEKLTCSFNFTHHAEPKTHRSGGLKKASFDGATPDSNSGICRSAACVRLLTSFESRASELRASRLVKQNSGVIRRGSACDSDATRDVPTSFRKPRRVQLQADRDSDSFRRRKRQAMAKGVQSAVTALSRSSVATYTASRLGKTAAAQRKGRTADRRSVMPSVFNGRKGSVIDHLKRGTVKASLFIPGKAARTAPRDGKATRPELSERCSAPQSESVSREAPATSRRVCDGNRTRCTSRPNPHCLKADAAPKSRAYSHGGTLLGLRFPRA